jgi:hypothetical protein
MVESNILSLLFASNTITLPYVVGVLIIVLAFIGFFTCVYFSWWMFNHMYADNKGV